MVTLEEYKNDMKMYRDQLVHANELSYITAYELFMYSRILGGDASMDICDKEYDVEVCLDLPDDYDDVYDQAIAELMKHIDVIKVTRNGAVCDLSQFVRDHTKLVYDLSQFYNSLAMPDMNLDKDWKEMEYEEDDSLYQGVRTLIALIPGDGVDEQYQMIVDYFKKEE